MWIFLIFYVTRFALVATPWEQHFDRGNVCLVEERSGSVDPNPSVSKLLVSLVPLHLIYVKHLSSLQKSQFWFFFWKKAEFARMLEVPANCLSSTIPGIGDFARWESTRETQELDKMLRIICQRWMLYHGATSGWIFNWGEVQKAHCQWEVLNRLVGLEEGEESSLQMSKITSRFANIGGEKKKSESSLLHLSLLGLLLTDVLLHAVVQDALHPEAVHPGNCRRDPHGVLGEKS